MCVLSRFLTTFLLHLSHGSLTKRKKQEVKKQGVNKKKQRKTENVDDRKKEGKEDRKRNRN
jgi:hypothetical protein